MTTCTTPFIPAAELANEVQSLLQGYLGIARRKLGADSADDVIQDAAVKTLRNLDKWNPERGTLSKFVYCIFRSTVADHFRSRSRHSVTESDLGQSLHNLEPGVDPDEVNFDQYDRLHAAIAALDDHDSQLIRMHFFDGRTCSEIAAITDTPVSTVKGRLRSAKDRLAAVYNTESDRATYSQQFLF